MPENVRVSVGIVSYLGRQDLFECLDSLYSYHKNAIDNHAIEVYLCDNSPNHSIIEMIESNFSFVKVTRKGINDGFGSGHNSIIKAVDSDYHLILNPDIVFHDTIIPKLASYLSLNSDISLTTPEIRNIDETTQHLPKKYPKLRYVLSSTIPILAKFRAEYTRENENITSPADIEVCTGCFMFTRTETLKAVGGFDEGYFMYFEDFDISLKIARLGRLVYNPEVYVTHKWNRASKKSLKMFLIQVKSMFRFYLKRGIKL